MIKPLFNLVVIEPLENDTTTKSGIVLPESAKETQSRGRVVAVGPGKRTKHGFFLPLAVKIDDVVLVKKYGPDEIEIDSKKYLVVNEEDILAILE